MKKLYLDACCVGRPYDDQSQERIRLESESVLFVLDRIQAGEWTWTGSSALNYEVDHIPDLKRRQRVRTTMDLIERSEVADAPEIDRGRSLQTLGFKAMDALHIACAEKAGCEVLLTTDDRMLRTARRHSGQLSVRVVNPVDWVREVQL